MGRLQSINQIVGHILRDPTYHELIPPIADSQAIAI